MNDLQKELVLSLRKYCETSIELESIAMICFLLRKLPQNGHGLFFSSPESGVQIKGHPIPKKGDWCFLSSPDIGLIQTVLQLERDPMKDEYDANEILSLQLSKGFED